MNQRAKTRSDDDEKRRVERRILARDAFYSFILTQPDSQRSFYPLINVLRLYLQRNDEFIIVSDKTLNSQKFRKHCNNIDESRAKRTVVEDCNIYFSDDDPTLGSDKKGFLLEGSLPYVFLSNFQELSSTDTFTDKYGIQITTTKQSGKGHPSSQEPAPENYFLFIAQKEYREGLRRYEYRIRSKESDKADNDDVYEQVLKFFLDMRGRYSRNKEAQKYILHIINKYFEEHRRLKSSRNKISSNSTNRPEADRRIAKLCLHFIEQVVDDIYSELSKIYSISYYKGKSGVERAGVPNLFFTIVTTENSENRFRDINGYPYTFRYLFPKSQRDAIREEINENRNAVDKRFPNFADYVLENLDAVHSHPFLNERSGLDASATSGLISLFPLSSINDDYCLPEGADHFEEEAGEFRSTRLKLLENISALQFGEKERNNYALLTIPVIVSGSAYLIVSTFYRISEKDFETNPVAFDAWWENFVFYRDVFERRIVRKVRRGMLNAYVLCVGAIIYDLTLEHFEETETDLSNVKKTINKKLFTNLNRSLSVAPRFFPFKSIHLSDKNEATDESQSITFFGKTIYAKLQANCMYLQKETLTAMNHDGKIFRAVSSAFSQLEHEFLASAKLSTH